MLHGLQGAAQTQVWGGKTKKAQPLRALSVEAQMATALRARDAAALEALLKQSPALARSVLPDTPEWQPLHALCPAFMQGSCLWLVLLSRALPSQVAGETTAKQKRTTCDTTVFAAARHRYGLRAYLVRRGWAVAGDAPCRVHVD
eukprot:scaffold2879_cov269-Prasinococcus_capsulatus_cf.AAC.31